MRPHTPIKRARIILGSMVTRLKGRRRIHLLHIAKTGGTALKHALSSLGDVGDGLELVLHSHKTRLSDIPTGDAVFFCCRDPISRYRSGFMSRQRQGQPRNLIPWSEVERFAFSRFSNPADLAEALASSDLHTRREAELAFDRIRHVNTPLGYWLRSEELLNRRKCDIVWIGLQSELDNDFRRLAEMMELPASITLPTDDVTAHRNPGTASPNISAEGEKALLRRFENDLRLFQWCLRHRQQLLATHHRALQVSSRSAPP